MNFYEIEINLLSRFIGDLVVWVVAGVVVVVVVVVVEVGGKTCPKKQKRQHNI